MTPSPDSNTGPAYPLLFADLMEEVLSFANNPKECGDNITLRIRELTGVRVVALLQKPLQAEDDYQLLAVCPARHRPLIERRETLALARLGEQFTRLELLRSDADTAAAKILSALGVGDSILIPLTVADVSVGTLLLLDILTSTGIESITSLLQNISTALALVLRNAILYNQMETLVNERTKALQAEIIERQKVEASLRASEERYALAQNAAQIGSWEWNISSGELLWSEQIEPMFGFAKGGFGGTYEDFLSCLHPDDRALVVQSTNNAIDKDEKYELEHRIIWPDKSLHWLRETGEVFRDSEGRPLRMLGIVQDITGSKKMEQALLKIKKLEATACLAGGIAHDFNNLLSAILGNIELAEGDAANGSPQEKSLRGAKEATLRAATLTRKFITFSSGGSPLKKAIGLGEFLTDTATVALSGSNICCDFSLAPDLLMVDIDPGQMSQAIGNIITNSKEAMPQGGRLRLSAHNLSASQMAQETGLIVQGDFFIKISIEDQGKGIPKQDMANIFDPYFSSKERGEQKGMGLGLTIADSILKKHGGHILVESEEGRGTTASLYLPALDRRESEIGITADQAADSPTPAREKKTTRLLVMDDEETLRDMTQKMLKSIGYEQVEVAPHGEGVLRLYTEAHEQGQPIDLLLLDLTIKGGMGGAETIKRLLEMNPAVRAIVCSGYADDPIIANFADYGFSGVLVKPFCRNDLNNAITKALDKK